ncbi:MAG: Uma2 family endonuclease [Chloroflexi bacterium]|nr:Uma2 family endonuclease [Chloroflexota bacterium]MCC6893312.1 Uma2 family endonuclease [Anaerolineae bacterium]
MFNTRLSVDEFLRIALAPENADRRLQLIDGEIVEVVSNSKNSRTAVRIATFVNGFALPRNLGEMSGADGGYTIEGEQYIPDCAFVSYQRQPHTTTEAYPDIAPDLVVEVLSPGNMSSTDEREKMFRKIGNYLAAGCELWLVYPDEEKLERYIQGEAVRTYRNGDVLEGRGVLEGFKLEISTIWPR